MIRKETLHYLWPFFLYKLLKGALFITTITFFVFFLQQGITYFEASVLLALQFSIPVLFEVPTGLIADVYGRKLSVLLGVLIEILVLVGIVLTSNYLILIALFIFWGIGGAFCSEADNAWAIEKIPDEKKESIIDEYYPASASAFGLGMFIAGLASTVFISLYGQTSVWYVRIVLAFIMFLLLLCTRENFLKTKEAGTKGAKLFSINLKESLIHFKKENRTRNIILAELFVTIALVGAGGAALQDYLQSSHLPSSSWGSVYSVTALVGLAIPFLAMAASQRFRNKKQYLVTVLSGHGLLFLFAGFILNPVFAIFFIFAHNIAEDFFNPVSMAFFQQKLPSNIRATLGSFHSMSLGVGALIGMLGGGYLSDQFGGQVAIAIAPLFLIPAIAFYLKIGGSAKGSVT